ncbi:hypothetical protein [Lysobacter sp. CFH 32150]|uniref:hypothetical protein n=1 Tax=Lysobacter sp. CFH 32150 TaxID=2927128 RepID=UPI001FA77B38|nr:hypothetical protein [Lysobacter sp. CFH 32150]MCI4567590.1 hypothetical protein [Lysobacter sp. CFH 32150]
MLLIKTEKARAALLDQRSAGLSLAERRALILSDGKRSRNDLIGLLGPDILAALDRLVRDGYLGEQHATTNTLAAAANVFRSTPATTPTPLRAVPAAREPSTAVVACPAPASRRSLAATKMYLLDMLQLQRDPESVALKAEIQTSPSEDELVYRMMKALRHIQSIANASYAQRVAERMAEIIPEVHLPKLEQVRIERLALGSAVA